MNIAHFFLSFLFPKYTWQRPSKQKNIYLTFDDGPIPEVTEWVLDILSQYQIKATFFCIGDNVRKHPLIFNRIIQEGHQIGNHTFNHLNGWKNNTREYISNFYLAEKEMTKHVSLKNRTLLFRPPYGKIKKQQANEILAKGYEVIMWSNLTKDYDRNTAPQECYKRAIKNMAPGSIIVFHDSIKASQNLYYALPKTIDYLLAKGYSFTTL